MHFVFIQRLCENGSGPIRRRYYAAIFTSSIPKYKHANIKLQSLSNKSSSHSFLNDGDSKNPSTKYAIAHAITKSRLVQQAPLYRGSSLLYFLGISMVQKSDPLRKRKGVSRIPAVHSVSETVTSASTTVFKVSMSNAPPRDMNLGFPACEQYDHAYPP